MALKWTLSDLLKNKEEGYVVDETVQLPLDLFHVDPEIRQLSPIHVHGYVEFMRHSITFHLTIDGTMVLPCAITLEDVDYPFHIRTSETFLLSPNYRDEELDEDDLVHTIEDDEINLTPYIVEAILVEKPMRIVSESAEKRANPSGEGWDLVSENEQKKMIDPRLEKLKKFFDE
ncbi:hypothetical protein GMB86_08265 [Terrilactibacillus sp. BCM23-1]|uniref:DUF177 domain-containing protein n=1 Tax=Terrilactibacillus tamarindi TaxID=2599694 RepID=A0A6N8CPB2_9BACI|nr:YceD family protein [Terrilactibacillus tamarindi]MTT32004.1 hypothetical protein [Terrilactibacillus tamarindi]